MQTVPSVPEEADGLALEDRNDDVYDAPDEGEQCGTPEQARRAWSSKHLDVEEKRGEL